MDSNAYAVIQAVFHVILVIMFHGRRREYGIKARRNFKRFPERDPIRPRVQISKPLKP
jgi:hypothetical protein